MENRRDVTVPMPASLVDDVESELEYGNSRAEWIREAIRMRLAEEQSVEQ
jgi:hypothetical protein